MSIKWLLIAVIVATTTVGEICQAMGMRRHGEIRDFRPGALGRVLSLLSRNWIIVASVIAMAVSFFAYLGLLTVAQLRLVPVLLQPRIDIHLTLERAEAVVR